MRTPAGMSEATFAVALEQMRSVVGRDYVFTEEDDLDLYRDAYSPLWDQPEERIASAAVAPATVEQVQAVVRIADAYGVPIYPISTGKNLGYGGSAPAYSSSVVLDLKRMDRVLEIDEVNGTVLVEPGVSYFDLYRVLQERGFKLSIDCPDPGWGSVIGNALDRGGGFTMAQFRNHFDAHCGMEVVLADGSLLRTGMGALPGARTWQQYKSGFGPWVDGIFSQSNFGVVTKMGFWLMPLPEAFRRCVVTLPRYQDLGPAVEILNRCENSRLFTGFPDLAAPLLLSAHSADRTRLTEQGSDPPDPEHAALLVGVDDAGWSSELQAYGLRRDIPYWSVSLSFYGPPEVIAAQWGAVKRLYRAIDGARFRGGETVSLPVAEERQTDFWMAELGIPSLRIFSAGSRTPSTPTPNYGHLWFSPIIPRTGAAIIEANQVIRGAARELGLPLLGGFTLPALVWERGCIFIYGVSITRDPQTDNAHVAAIKGLIRIAAERGWGEYRTAPVFQDACMQAYSFDDHALLRFHERLKDAVDPNGILSAGRYGIWPKHLRGGRG